jgi:putative ABC transport system ATP-binding protein
MSYVLEARGVIKELGQGAGKVRALKGVDLSLEAGELTLLMGPSGSGKTTLLSILGCILAPTSGAVEIAGENTIGRTPEDLADLRRRHIGFVFQQYNLFPTLTAHENVRLALDVRGDRGAAASERAKEALLKVGLGHRLGNYPRNLSGGEQQRVAVARAIASAPSLILADEPTAALDTENGRSVMTLIKEISADETRAVLAVTHDPRTLPFADRIIHIEDGLIVSDERPKSEQAPAKPALQTAPESAGTIIVRVDPAASPASATHSISIRQKRKNRKRRKGHV